MGKQWKNVLLYIRNKITIVDNIDSSNLNNDFPSRIFLSRHYGVSVEVIIYYVNKFNKLPSFYIIDCEGKFDIKRELLLIERLLKIKKINVR